MKRNELIIIVILLLTAIFMCVRLLQVIPVPQESEHPSCSLRQGP